MGTRTYSRRGAGGIRVLTALGRARQARQGASQGYTSIDYTNLPEDTRKRATDGMVPLMQALVADVMKIDEVGDDMFGVPRRATMQQLINAGIDVNNPNDLQLLADLFGVFDAYQIAPENINNTSASASTPRMSYYASPIQSATSLYPDVEYDGANVQLETWVPGRDGRKPFASQTSVKLKQQADGRYSLDIFLDLFAARGSTGMGYAFIARQLAAIDELVRRGKVDPDKVVINMKALQNKDRGINGISTWPKLGFNIDVKDLPYNVRGFIAVQGFSRDIPDTNTLFQSQNKDGVYGYDIWREAIDRVKQEEVKASFIYNNPVQRRIIEEYGKRKGFVKQMETGVSLDLTADDERILRDIWIGR